MTRRQQVAVFWLSALAVLLVVLFVLRAILLPFAAGMALAYALNPIADWLEQRGFNRSVAAVIILTLALGVFALMLLLFAPVLVRQLADLIERLPDTIERLQDLFSSFIDSRLAAFLGFDAESLRQSLTGFMASGTQFITGLIPSLWSGGVALINILSLFIITPFVAFYVLRDWHRMIARVDALLPRDHADEIRELARQMDLKVAAFVRGQMLSGLLLGAFYAVGLLIVGLNYGLLIGLAAGIISFIPYAGFTAGFVVSMLVAVGQFWPEWPWIAAVVVVFMLGQLLEGYILQPRLLGSMVGLHPVWLLFALFAFGALFGFVGLLIAVPAAAALGVVFTHGVVLYRASALFRGNETDPK